jgi:hypothetical protein
MFILVPKVAKILQLAGYAKIRIALNPKRLVGWIVKLTLKTPYSDGTTHLLFTPEEFIEKLCAIIPPPKSHLVRWGGVFASNSPLRRRVVVKPDKKKGFDFGDGKKRVRNKSWSLMLARVFKIDVLKCSCGGDLRPLGAIKDLDQVQRYLKHAGIDCVPPSRAPPRLVQEELQFEEAPSEEEYDVVIYRG